MRLLIASGNAKKVVELRRLVEQAGLSLEVVGLHDVTPYDEPAETGDTFEANALIKARAGMAVTGLPTLADDSGIEVDVLNRMPGVRSARWAGPGSSDTDNLELLLRQISDVEPARRRGRFVCAMALVRPDGTEEVLRRTMEGVVVDSPRGANGFGYDPIFVTDGHDVTNAELSPDEKDAVSHRGQAVRAMLPVLARLEVS
ncbi:MAG TPA: RdgB/HAM1 family non-canonical purine NTP pyrophosphatase [Propionibacteriaceae bacterium]|nr:RdgB/HAM1 family non-canonical purine NTP pyrophosphatase [Propionibacteriaceae bacterium]